MLAQTPQFSLRLAANAADLAAVQRLRYDVFVTELGGDGPGVDHASGRETDRFDPYADHLMLHDRDKVVGSYRLMTDDAAAKAGGYYSAQEFDLEPLFRSGRRLLELGRSCLRADYRGGAALFHLWQALAVYAADHGTEVMFGTASFPGTEPRAIAASLAHLHHAHLAPPALRVAAQGPAAITLDQCAPDKYDRRAAVLGIPALIKSYLKLGGTVGEGAFIDHAFNTIDVCLILDLAQMNTRQRALYERPQLP